MPIKSNQSISTIVFSVVLVIVIVIAAIGYALYFMQTPSQPSTTSSNYQTVTGLAYSHWTSIGDANLSGTMSQYTSSAALWWYVHNSPLNTTSGPYTGSAISATWTKFFNNGPTYWTVYNYTLVFTSSTTAKVTADVWYVLGHGSSTHTLYLPYELDYTFQNGQWSLSSDWWGLPHNPGVVYSGVVTPGASTVSSSTSASQTTTTSSTSGGGGYGGY
ncbi:MAG: hypothetical protein ACYCQJ_03255 [Nitrososphaerales archaeon]